MSGGWANDLFSESKHEASLVSMLNNEFLPSEQIGFYTKLDLRSAVIELGMS